MINPPITSDPNYQGGTLGEPGAAWGVNPDGTVDQVPVTNTPPYGEPPLYNEPDAGAFVAPAGPAFSQAAEDAMLHEWVYGTPWHGYDIEEWVNPSNPGIPNLGPVNVQAFESAHTNAIPHNASAEQGWGLDPAILYARYPKVQNTNPFYSSGAFRRMGGLAWAVPGIPFSQVTQQDSQKYAAGRRRPSNTHGAIADVPPNVPSGTNVPVYGNAGPLDILPPDDQGIYY